MTLQLRTRENDLLRQSLQNFWEHNPYPPEDINADETIVFANEILLPWKCKFVREEGSTFTGYFEFDSEQDWMFFLLRWS